MTKTLYVTRDYDDDDFVFWHKKPNRKEVKDGSTDRQGKNMGWFCECDVLVLLPPLKKLKPGQVWKLTIDIKAVK